MRLIQNFIGGEYTTGLSGKTFEKRSPLDNSVIARVTEAGRDEVDAAVCAARAALHGEWGGLTLEQRVDLLYGVADEITRRFEDFVAAEMADTGQPSHVMRHVFIPRGAANFKVFADVVKNVPTESFQMSTPDGRGALNYAIRAPKGVVGCDQSVERALPADDLEGGPGPGLRQHRGGEALRGVAPHGGPAGRGDERSGHPQGRLQRGAGLRAGLGRRVPDPSPGRGCHHLHRRDAHRRGHHEGGLRRHARRVLRAGRQERRHRVCRLPTFDAAVDGIFRSAFLNTGQVCLGTERVYVERPIFERFVQALKAKARR
jgi:aminomuconate-semialdehyde/2-hydroxymuconate-6-semialdehyde dehydrogenase